MDKRPAVLVLLLSLVSSGSPLPGNKQSTEVIPTTTGARDVASEPVRCFLIELTF